MKESIKLIEDDSKLASLFTWMEHHLPNQRPKDQEGITEKGMKDGGFIEILHWIWYENASHDVVFKEGCLR